MKLLRCRICGETYLGTKAPTRCPFCGAADQHLVAPDLYSAAENHVAPTEVERADLDTAIALERSNARFYTAMSRMGGDESLASAYKRLSSIEAEHCSVLCKLAGEMKPNDLREPEGDPRSWEQAIAESAARERRAADFYAAAASRTTTPRIREVFDAVSAVEIDHLEIDRIAAIRARGLEE